MASLPSPEPLHDPMTPDGRKNYSLLDERVGLFQVLGIVRLNLTGPYWWQTDDIDDPPYVGATFSMFARDGGNGAQLGSIAVVDSTNDAEEPWVGSLAQEDVARVDALLRHGVTEEWRKRGARIEWMSSRLNRLEHFQALVTAYVAHEGSGAQQMVATRIEHCGRKLVLLGAFDAREAAVAGSHIIATLRAAMLIS